MIVLYSLRGLRESTAWGVLFIDVIENLKMFIVFSIFFPLALDKSLFRTHSTHASCSSSFGYLSRLDPIYNHNARYHEPHTPSPIRLFYTIPTCASSTSPQTVYGLRVGQGHW